MKKKLLILIAIFPIVVLTACTSTLPALDISMREGGKVVTEDDLKEATATYGGRLWCELGLDNEGSFTLTLYANLGAGMRWSASIEDTSIVRTVGRELIQDNLPGTVGGSSKEVWTFKALYTTGVTTITMTYSSLGLTSQPNVNTLEIVVDVAKNRPL